MITFKICELSVKKTDSNTFYIVDIDCKDSYGHVVERVYVSEDKFKKLEELSSNANFDLTKFVSFVYNRDKQKWKLVISL